MVGMEEERDVRQIGSVEELRALADPVRLAILSALDTRTPGGELPVMSVKELAQQLGEPQTKLYRHVKQLEAAGLIEVAATRMVSGILEQRYRTRQRDLRLSSALFRQHAGETEMLIRSAFDAFLNSVFDRARQDGWPSDGPSDGVADGVSEEPSDGPDEPVMLVYEDRVSPEAAERIRTLVAELKQEVAEAEAGATTVSVAVGFYGPASH